MDRRDRRVQEVTKPDRLEIFAVAEPDPGSLVAEFREWLGRAMQALPPKQREALHLVKLRELFVADAACSGAQSTGTEPRPRPVMIAPSQAIIFDKEGLRAAVYDRQPVHGG